MKVTKEEKEFVEKSLADFRAKKSKPEVKEPELEVPEIEQEIDFEEDAENRCASCGWELDGKPDKCPQCDVDLDWE